MNRRDGHHIVFNIQNVYITINQGGTDCRNNNDGREETNRNPTSTPRNANQRNNSENDGTRETSKVSESTDPTSSQAVVINQPSTSRTNENLNPETEDRTGSLGGPEIEKQLSDNDKIAKSAPEQNSQNESENRSELQPVLEKYADVIVAKTKETENENNEPCVPKAASDRTEPKDTILTKTEDTSSTEFVNSSTESESSEIEKDRAAAASESSAKAPEKAKQDDDNKENNGRKKAFNPSLSFNFSPDLLKIKDKEATDLVLSEKPSFQFTNHRKSAPEPFFKFQAKPEKVPSIEASRCKLTNRKIFIRSQINSSIFGNGKKRMVEDNAEIGQKKT